MKRAVLIGLAALLLSMPAMASESIYPIDKGSSYKIDFTAGGGFVQERYIALGKPSWCATDSTLSYPIVNHDSLGATESKTITFTAAQNESLVVGGVPARQLKILLYAETAADIDAGNIVITGTNAKDETITENVAVTNNTKLNTVSTMAYKTVTTIVAPLMGAKTEAGATLSIGRGPGIGLPFTTHTYPIMLFAKGVTGTNIKTGSAPTTAVVGDSCWLNDKQIEYNFYRITPGSYGQPSQTYDILFWVPRWQGSSARTRW